MTIENVLKFSFGNVQVNIFKIETRSVRKKNLTFSRPNSKNQKKKKKTRKYEKTHLCPDASPTADLARVRFRTNNTERPKSVAGGARYLSIKLHYL